MSFCICVTCFPNRHLLISPFTFLREGSIQHKTRVDLKEVKKVKMKHSETQLPSSALDFYVKLYCRRRRGNKSKHNNVLSEATKSWLTLSKSEKHHFTTKYEEIKRNIKSQFANQLKNAVPYLKKKVVPVPRDIELQTKEDEGDNILDVIEDSEIPNTEGNIADTSFGEPNNYNHVIETSIQDASNENLYENYIPISEPIPPKLLTGQQLFNMVNETENNQTWATLTTTQKRKYQSAVISIKRNYLKEYTAYLNQLSSEKLYEHYKNNVSSE